MNKLNLKPNVIEREELQTMFKTIFNQMSEIVERTYGPFGENTAYQYQNRLLITKDGWTVEQGVNYSKNVLANIITKLIIEVSRSINIQAGDGTTTGIIVANELNNQLLKYKEEHPEVHPKFISEAFESAIELICKNLKENATMVTEENMSDIIYRVACISLNWDKRFANYIKEIYENTKNPLIRVQNSGYESSYIDYTDGYEIDGRLMSEFKVNVNGVNAYDATKPFILPFSYTITASLFEKLLKAAMFLKMKTGRELIILAPEFEKDFRDNYNAICIRLAKDNKPSIPMIMAKYRAEYTIEREMMTDLYFLIGTNVISREYSEPLDKITEFFDFVDNIPEPKYKDYDNTADYNNDMKEYSTTVNEATYNFINDFSEFVGTCDTVRLDDKHITFSGFNGLENSVALEQRKNVIRAAIDKANKIMTAKSIFTEEIKLKRMRLSKLQLKMGTIYVGGFGEGDLKQKRDALDDAINACQNAYLEGVTIGGGIAIPSLICKLTTTDDSQDSLNNYANETGVDLELLTDMLNIIEKSYADTVTKMFKNKYGNVPYITKKDGRSSENNPLVHVVESILKGVPYNIITEEYDESLIHPVKVETEVLKGCLHLITITTTVNQLLYNGFEGIDQELENMREVVE